MLSNLNPKLYNLIESGDIDGAISLTNSNYEIFADEYSHEFRYKKTIDKRNASQFPGNWDIFFKKLIFKDSNISTHIDTAKKDLL